MSRAPVEAAAAAAPAAPAPVVPISPTANKSLPQTPPRSTSRSRTVSSLKSRQRTLNSNDPRIVAPTSDVINDLLASFPDISRQQNLQPSPAILSPVTRTPVRRSRNPSTAPTPRISTSPQRAISPSTHEFYEYSHPIQDAANLPPEQDAAEPPVIRTARPPSALSKSENKKSTSKLKNRTVASPQVLLSPPPEPVLLNGQPAAKSERKVARSGYASPSILKASRRDSLESARGSESLQSRFLRLTSRQKSPNVYSPSRSSLRAEANDSQRAGMPSSVVQSPAMYSIPQSARQSEDKGGRGIPENSIPASPSATFVNGYAHDPDYDLSTEPQNGTAAHVTAPDSPPSLYPKAPPSEPVVIPDELPSTLSSAPEPAAASFDENPDTQESDVMRRIKELKAAREERRKSQEYTPRLNSNVVNNSTDPETETISPLNGARSDTIVASQQLVEGPQIEEKERTPNNPNIRDEYTLDAKNTPIINATSSKPPIQTVNNSQVMAGGPDLNAARAAVPPHGDPPELSYPSSRRKRWSPLSAPATQPSSPKPEHRRNRNSFSRQPALVESARPSIDVVNASVRDFLMAPRLSQRIKYPADGRIITFSEVGDPNGSVVICCVGMGLTRYIMAYYDELAVSLKLRLITPDRPGIGDSAPYSSSSSSPFDWPSEYFRCQNEAVIFAHANVSGSRADDIKAICAKLGVSKFSLLAHSAGTIYALATALRMPELVRGKIHLLAPWIPQSQLSSSNAVATADMSSGAALTKSQRFLRILPTSLLKLSNSSLPGINRNNSPKPTQTRGRKSSEAALRYGQPSQNLPPKATTRPPSPRLEDVVQLQPPLPSHEMPPPVLPSSNLAPSAEKERQRMFDEALTPAIWEMATKNGNPAIDLLVCLERNRPIGFRYADVGSKPAGVAITAKSDLSGLQWPGYGFVIHHGSKDNRVPIENVKWLGRHMTNAEVRVLEGQGHGLMAAAGVMSGVLTEIGKEWETQTW